MNPEKFGDSYDIVKKEIIHGLAPADEWAVHPMYFEVPRRWNFVHHYANFLGISLVDGPIYDRRFLVPGGVNWRGHLFLDPDTGLWVPGVGGVNEEPRDGWDEHISVNELVQIANAEGCQRRITLVYDQTYNRNYRAYGNLVEQVREKLLELRDHHVCSAAYVSHAVFIWVSADERTLYDATRRLRMLTKIPVTRIIGLGQ